MILFSISYNKENPERLKKNFNSITTVPGILSTLAYIFFIGGYFVGPQYSYKHFIQCLQRNKDEPYDIPLQLVLQKFLLSVTLLVLIVACFDPLSTTYVLETEEFHSMSYIKRCFHWVCWGHLVIVKYTMVWTLAEGVVILAGIGYNPNAKGINYCIKIFSIGLGTIDLTTRIVIYYYHYFKI